MTAQQHRAIEAFRNYGYSNPISWREYRGIEGLGVTQQQAAATVGSALLSSARYAGPAAPFLAIGGAIADIVSLFGPNPNNTITTGYVNQIEADVMKPNLLAWQALAPEHKIYSMQQAALANFMAGWNQVLQLCSNPALGSAGTNCIGDRQRGGKWDWWKFYYFPIKDDPEVIPDPVVGSSGGAVTDNTVAVVSSALGGISPLWIGMGLIAIALVTLGDS